MALTNAERIGKALAVFNIGMKPFVERELEAAYGEDWREMVEVNISATNAVHWDTYALLKTLWNQWNDVFKDVMDQGDRTLIRDLQDWRNKWAHQEKLTTEDAHRALDTVERLLKAVGAPEALEIENQKQELLRILLNEQARKEPRETPTTAAGNEPTNDPKASPHNVAAPTDVATGRQHGPKAPAAPLAQYDQAALAEKVARVFGDLAIDKRRLPMSQLQHRGIPSYVGEWVLDSIVPGHGPLTPEEAEKVQAWAARFVPTPGDQNVIKARLLRGDVVKILTKVQVEIIVKRNRQDKVAKLSLMGIDDAHIADELSNTYDELLRRGMWGVTEIVSTPEGAAVVSFKPMQATVNLPAFKEARKEFSLPEWRALMVLSMGYAPEAFTEDEQTLLLCRLLPLVQKSLHLMELAPKGTGKSYVYENISPMVRLVSSGNVSPAVLFVNNATGQWGILSLFAAVVLDEVQTLKFDKAAEVVSALKGFLANGTLTRGGLHETRSDCGLVLLANIALDENQRPLIDPLVRELPLFMRETAFLDRIKGIIPGWEIRKLDNSCFANTLGMKSDFFGDTLVALRNDMWADQICARRIRLLGNEGVRNEIAVRSIASGLLKILFPHGDYSDVEFDRYCVKPGIRLRQLVWDQLYSMDSEYRQFERHIDYELMA